MSYKFATPVILSSPSKAQVHTLDHAVAIVRASLCRQFTFTRLNMLLLLERVTDSDEVAEARRAFRSWASVENMLLAE